MKTLEKDIINIIKFNKDKFDDVQPLPGIEERFMDRLSSGQKNNRRKIILSKNMIPAISSAAAIVIILVLSFLYQSESDKDIAHIVADYQQQLSMEAENLILNLNFMDEANRIELTEDIMRLTYLDIEELYLSQLSLQEQISFVHQIYINHFESLSHMKDIIRNLSGDGNYNS